MNELSYTVFTTIRSTSTFEILLNVEDGTTEPWDLTVYFQSDETIMVRHVSGSGCLAQFMTELTWVKDVSVNSPEKSVYDHSEIYDLN